MKTQGEIEAAICEGISRFEQEYMGRGPKDIHAHLIGDLLVVRLQGVLTAAEQQLVKSLPAEKGRDLLKQVRTHLIETARPLMEAMVQEVTGVKVLSLHHDISTVTGEEVVLFTLTEPSRPRDEEEIGRSNRDLPAVEGDAHAVEREPASGSGEVSPGSLGMAGTGLANTPGLRGEDGPSPRGSRDPPKCASE